MNVPVRTITAALVGITALAVVVSRTAPDTATASMLRVLLSSAVVGFIPGALAVLAWHPRRSFDAIELAGLALAVSFGFNELLTIAALLAHWGPVVSLALLGTFVLVAAAVAWRRTSTVDVGWHHVAIAAGLAILAVYLYGAGSGYDNTEDRIHIAIIERLSYLSRPSFRNIYFAPDVVYTYPFPGTHYMLALMSRLSELPAIFVYVKLRAFWGAAAIVLVYGCVRSLLDSTRIAVAATVTVMGLVANGAFADVPGMYWGQLAPFSHASDVAMGVLLPALMLLAFEVVRSSSRREYWFSMIAMIALALMLIIVHVREIVQFIVYIAAFTLALALARAPRPWFARSAVILAAVVAMLVAYRAWNAWAVPLVDSLVEAHRRDLRDLYNASTWRELFGQPYPLLRNYMPGFESIRYGLDPVVLLLSPLILIAVRGSKLTWLIGASIVSYLLIVRYPVFAIPYTYATYFEILYTPVRNVVFFIHILAGIGLFVLAAHLAQLTYVALVPLAAAAGVLIVLAIHRAAPILSLRIDLLFVPMLVSYALLLVMMIWRGRREAPDAKLLDPPPRWMAAFAIVFAIVLYGTRIDESAVVSRRWENRTPTPTSLMAAMPCNNDVDCPPPPALIRLAHERVSPDSLFAVDLHERYQPALFMPQQMVVWTGGTESLLEPETLFPRYFTYLKAAQNASVDQPLFNRSETRKDREAFLRDLHVTHVLVNPRLYPSIKPVFDADTDLFVPRYDDGRWALYEVSFR
jgi:hypothetical protein